MRNLRFIHRSVIQSPPGLQLTASAWDVATESAICAFGPEPENPVVELKRWNKDSHDYTPITSWDAPCPLPDLESDQILDFHYFADSLTACLVFAGGDLVVVREEPQDGEDKIEIVGSVDAGISAAAWSPDEELLAITTRASTLLYMTRYFEGIVDYTLSVGDLSVSQHVNVGWGKKETQFKGKKARALRDPTIPETVDEGNLSDQDDRRTSISWRGDGTYVAINSIIETDALTRRVIRVFSREGTLDSVSEPLNGLEGCLAWRPAGNLLASIQRLGEKLSVVFFERNGLRHGQFDLRLSKEEQQSWGSNICLRWNVDSSTLAVRFLDRIQLWTMSNYRYSLKQEMHANRQDCSFSKADLIWHPEKALHFLVLGEGCLNSILLQGYRN